MVFYERKVQLFAMVAQGTECRGKAFEEHLAHCLAWNLFSSILGWCNSQQRRDWGDRRKNRSTVPQEILKINGPWSVSQ